MGRADQRIKSFETPVIGLRYVDSGVLPPRTRKVIEPPKARPWAEAARLARGFTTLPGAFVRTDHVPPGRGQTVLVVPGFATGDTSTWFIRRFLRRIGYRTFGWGLGINRGDVASLTPRVADVIRKLSRTADGPIKVVGWSLGGVLAREASRHVPGLVDHIVTLGTPVVGGPKYTLVANRYRQRGMDLDEIEQRVAQRNRERLPVDVTAVYSRKDGVVAWKACLDDNPSNNIRYIEVDTGHAELGFSGPVLRAVARSLSDHRADD